MPFVSGTPTVLSQIGRALFGTSGVGQFGYYSLQFGTALILILGANTSYNGFPLLVSFIAEDAYLPRPFTTRGHRLVYSNGIVALTVVSIAHPGGDQGPGRRPHPALRLHGLHRLHHGRRRDDEVPPDPPGSEVAPQHRHQRDRLRQPAPWSR